MSCILLTGATGFLGSRLLKRFFDLGYKVVGVKRTTSNLWRLKGYAHSIRFINSDESGALEAFFQNTPIDTIIHTACAYGRGEYAEREVFEANVDLPVKLAQLARQYKASVYINTDSFFAKPEFGLGYMGAYVLSKRHCWDWLLLFRQDLKVINMRLEHVYGPQDDQSKFISWLCKEFASSHGQLQSVDLSSCSQSRDFIYIDDVVSAFQKVVDSAGSIESGQIFEVGTSKAISVKLMVESIHSAFSRAGKNGVRPSFDASRDRPGEILKSSANTLTLRNLGWVPKFSLAEGIERLVEAELNGEK